jgi:hypothetical protein
LKVVGVCQQKIIRRQKAKLSAISGTNTGDQDLSSFATNTDLASKVDKVIGKGLSTEDYSAAEKAKLGSTQVQYRRSGFEVCY